MVVVPLVLLIGILVGRHVLRALARERKPDVGSVSGQWLNQQRSSRSE